MIKNSVKDWLDKLNSYKYSGQVLEAMKMTPQEIRKQINKLTHKQLKLVSYCVCIAYHAGCQDTREIYKIYKETRK